MLFTRYVFVDFENVPSVDLGVIEGQPVHVTLLIGKHQGRFDLPFVQQAMRHAAQVELIPVGVSGRNALDLVLAAYLGRASQEHKEADFVVVSKDKDFDPLIAHLRANGTRVARQPDFFARAHRASRAIPRPATERVASAPAVARAASIADEEEIRSGTLVARFTTGTGPLPKSKARLARHLAAHFGNKKSDAEIDGIMQQLEARGVIAIDDRGRVTYPKRGPSRTEQTAHG